MIRINKNLRKNKLQKAKKFQMSQINQNKTNKKINLIINNKMIKILNKSIIVRIIFMTTKNQLKIIKQKITIKKEKIQLINKMSKILKSKINRMQKVIRR